MSITNAALALLVLCGLAVDLILRSPMGGAFFLITLWVVGVVLYARWRRQRPVAPTPPEDLVRNPDVPPV